jgi:hypothetical protein
MESIMKKVAFVTLVCSLLVTTLSLAQTEDGAYLNIDYLKVETEDLLEFEQLVTSEWKEVLQEEVTSGNIIGGYFYRVVYPGGNLSKYNYVFVRTYENLNAIMEASLSLGRQMGSRKDDLMEKSMNLASHQYSELWRTEAGVMTPEDTSYSEYLIMNYMRVEPGMESQYLALENDIARPLHEERIEKERMHNWRTYSIMKPSGTGYDYNFATADYYDNLVNIEYGFTNEIMNSVMPSANFTETMEAINNSREIVASELWQLVYYLK